MDTFKDEDILDFEETDTEGNPASLVLAINSAASLYNKGEFIVFKGKGFKIVQRKRNKTQTIYAGLEERILHRVK